MAWIKYNDFISVEPELGLINRNEYIDTDGRKRKEKPIRGYIDHKGYLTFGLKTDNGYKIVRYHRIIWECANGAIPENHQIHHLNYNKLDNRIENLILLSTEEHSKIHCKEGGIANYLKYGCTLTKEDRKKSIDKLSKPILQFDKDNNLIKEFASIHNAARELNLIVQNIQKVCKGERKTCGGYKFRYK